MANSYEDAKKWLEGIKKEGKLDTLPKNFRDRARRNPKKIAMRKKNLGIWNELTWEECYEKVKHLALGMVSLGLEKGDKICIIGDNDPEWFWSEVAALCVGAISIGIYIDSVPEEIKYIADHSESVFAFAKDQEQVDKFLEIRKEMPRLKKIVYWDTLGMWSYKDNPWIMEITDVMELGAKFEKENPDFFDKRIDEGTMDDLAIFSYTSGTTGLPKGVMLAHDMFIYGAREMAKACDIVEDDEYLSFVSPAWIAEQGLGIGTWIMFGIVVNFPEEPDTVMQDLREIGAAYFLFGPKQWEDLLSMVQIRISDTTVIRRLVYKLCMPIGYKMVQYRLAQERAPFYIWWPYLLANSICFRPIKDYLGLRKLKIGLTGGSLLGPDTYKWFLAIGVHLSESYGASEGQPVTIHGKKLTVGTIGHLCDGIEAKVTDEGEMLFRHPALFRGYYKNPEATAEKVSKDGWFSTGDGVAIRDDGEVVYLDRVKDLLTLKGGAKYSPTYIENSLKFSQYIKDVMIVGDETKEFLIGLVAIDFNNVGRWSEKKRIPYTTFIDLSQKPEVYKLINNEMLRVNVNLPRNAKVEKFINLPKEFDPDEGEMTRTRKLKRNVISENYKELIDAAYSGKSEVVREAEVKYRDGRRGKIKATLRIMDVKGNNK